MIFMSKIQGDGSLISAGQKLTDPGRNRTCKPTSRNQAPHSSGQIPQVAISEQQKVQGVEISVAQVRRSIQIWRECLGHVSEQDQRRLDTVHGEPRGNSQFD